MVGHWRDTEWSGTSVPAWIPDPLSSVVDDLTARGVRLANAASEALRQGSLGLPLGWEPLARLLLRTEGVASSQIEEVRAPLPDIAAAELDPDLASPAAGWVADNLATVTRALDTTHRPLSVVAVHRWHSTLMRSADYLATEHVGAFRRELGWVGGPSPRLAAHVASPPEVIAGAVSDLVKFVNRRDIDPTVQAALAHAQFELIHPYADGNGRLGRVLISWILTRRLQLRVPPPVSVMLARDRGSYVGALAGFREIGPDHWVRYFAEIVNESAVATDRLIEQALGVIEEWELQLTDLRPMAAARRAVRLLAAHPVVSAEVIAPELGVSDRSARTALAELHARGIIAPYAPLRQRRGRPAQLWVAARLVEIVSTWGMR